MYRKTPAPESLFNKVAGLRPATLLKKKILAQVFSCEFFEICENTFFTEHLWTTASGKGCFKVTLTVFDDFKSK